MVVGGEEGSIGPEAKLEGISRVTTVVTVGVLSQPKRTCSLSALPIQGNSVI